MAVKNYCTMNGQLIGEYEGTRSTDYILDGLGSVIATFRSTGTIQNQYRYSGYGQQVHKSGTGTDPYFLWVGGWGYRTRGMVYVRRRVFYEDSAVWTSADPLWPDENAYGYAACCPTLIIDPTGYCNCKVAMRVNAKKTTFCYDHNNNHTHIEIDSDEFTPYPEGSDPFANCPKPHRQCSQPTGWIDIQLDVRHVNATKPVHLVQYKVDNGGCMKPPSAPDPFGGVLGLLKLAASFSKRLHPLGMVIDGIDAIRNLTPPPPKPWQVYPAIPAMTRCRPNTRWGMVLKLRVAFQCIDAGPIRACIPPSPLSYGLPGTPTEHNPPRIH